MYEVTVEASFTAVHRVRDARGELEPVHTHEWHVTATFAGAKLNEAGVLVDFTEAQRRLRQAVAHLDGRDLNECPVLNGGAPSAEGVARGIYDLLVKHASLCPLLRRVCVTEAPGCRASYVAP